jgi:hypothetical protein
MKNRHGMPVAGRFKEGGVIGKQRGERKSRARHWALPHRGVRGFVLDTG